MTRSKIDCMDNSIIKDISFRIQKAPTCSSAMSSVYIIFALIIGLITNHICMADPVPPTIDSIIVDNRNIFSMDSSAYNHWFFKLANRLHIKTRKYIVSREILQKTGESFSRELADETERNLRALPFLWDARVDYNVDENNIGVMKVTTSDRWTLAGGPSFSRVAGQNTIELRAEESNLLGLGQYVLFDYFHRQTKADYIQLSYLERRLLGTRNQFGISVNSDPEIGQWDFTLQKPFYSLNSKFGYSFSYSKVKRRIDYYSTRNKIAENRVGGELYEIGSTIRWGESHSKVFTGLTYQYRHLNFSDFKGSEVIFPIDSNYNCIFAQFGLQDIQYAKASRINNFGKVEDIPLLTGGVLTGGWYYDKSLKKLFQSISFSLDYALFWNKSFLFLVFNRKYWYDGNIDFRKQSLVSIKYYDNRFAWITPIMYAIYQEDLRKDRLSFLHLGENSGVRGYPKNYLSGERLFRVNEELRFFPGIRILSADIGAVQFVDMGQNIGHGGKFSRDDFLWSIGGGIRIGTGKISNHDIIRMDLAYAAKLKQWGVSLAAGQYIE